MTPIGFPHSEIPGSKLACSSPRLIAACHVLHRRHVPRHPPCALYYLTSILTASFSAALRWTSDSAQSAYKSYASIASPRPPLICEKILARTRLWVELFEKSLPAADGGTRFHPSPHSSRHQKAVTAIRLRHIGPDKKVSPPCLYLRLSLSRPLLSNSMT